MSCSSGGACSTQQNGGAASEALGRGGRAVRAARRRPPRRTGARAGGLLAVSEENIEVLRAGLAAINSGEIDRILEFVHPRLRGRRCREELSAEPDTYRGPRGHQPLLRDLLGGDGRDPLRRRAVLGHRRGRGVERAADREGQADGDPRRAAGVAGVDGARRQGAAGADLRVPARGAGPGRAARGSRQARLRGPAGGAGQTAPRPLAGEPRAAAALRPGALS